MEYYRYVYDSAGNIVRSIDITRKKEYNYTYESGRIIRATEYNITLDVFLNVIAKNVVTSIDYVYNAKGMLSKKSISASGSEIVYHTEYSENTTPVTKIKVNGRNVESHSKTDSFGRKVFDELRLGTGFVSRQFSYWDNCLPKRQTVLQPNLHMITTVISSPKEYWTKTEMS